MVIGFMVLGLLAIYLVLHFPIPAFASIRSMINYFMVLILWVVLQIAIIYGYYKLGMLVARGLSLYRGKLHLWMINIKEFMLVKR